MTREGIQFYDLVVNLSLNKGLFGKKMEKLSNEYVKTNGVCVEWQRNNKDILEIWLRNEGNFLQSIIRRLSDRLTTLRLIS